VDDSRDIHKWEVVMVRYKPPFRRNAFHYECDLSSTGYAGNFDLDTMAYASNGATVTNGRIHLTGAGAQEATPYVIVPLPEWVQTASQQETGGNDIFTVQAMYVFADALDSESPTIDEYDTLRLYILDQFADFARPIAFLDVRAGAPADPRDSVVTLYGYEGGGLNDSTYGDAFYIYDSGLTLPYTPVTVEMRLDLRQVGKNQVNYCLAHNLGVNTDWTNDVGMDNMFELERVAGDLDCDYRRPAFVAVEFLNYDGETEQGPASDSEVIVWGLHFAEDPYIVVGDQIGNEFLKSLALVRPDQTNPATTHAACPGDQIPQPVIGHCINHCHAMDHDGIGDAVGGRAGALTWNQGYRKVIVFPPYNEELVTLGGINRIEAIKADMETAFQALLSQPLEDIIICNIRPEGSSAGVGARISEEFRTVKIVNEWIKHRCHALGITFVDIHHALAYNDENEPDPEFDYLNVDYTTDNTNPDTGLSFPVVRCAVEKAMDRGARDHRRYLRSSV